MRKTLSDSSDLIYPTRATVSGVGVARTRRQTHVIEHLQVPDEVSVPVAGQTRALEADAGGVDLDRDGHAGVEPVSAPPPWQDAFCWRGEREREGA